MYEKLNQNQIDALLNNLENMEQNRNNFYEAYENNYELKMLRSKIEYNLKG